MRKAEDRENKRKKGVGEWRKRKKIMMKIVATTYLTVNCLTGLNFNIASHANFLR